MKKEKEVEITWCEAILCFDIETTSTKINGEKVAWMWGWSFSDCGKCEIGRTWEDFKNKLEYIKEKYDLSSKHKAIIWIHNLQHELQYLQGYFKINHKFGNVISCEMEECFQLRDTCILAGNISLEKLGIQLGFPKGDLNYDLIRTWDTEITEEEKNYMIRDVEILHKYITSQLEIYDFIAYIPYTNTSRCRIAGRNKCLYSKNSKSYKKQMHEMDMTVKQYEILKKCSMGGYIYANEKYCGKVLENVNSKDLDSSYPSEYLAALVPVGSPIDDFKDWIKSKEDIEKYSTSVCAAYIVTIHDLELKDGCQPTISEGHCEKISEDSEVRRHKIFYANEIKCGLLDLDLITLMRNYEVGDIEIHDVLAYYGGYMRKEMVELILDNYYEKSILKEDKKKDKRLEITYGVVKQILNGHSGNEIMDPCKYAASKEQGIFLYNTDKARYRIYQQGIWVLANARFRFHNVIRELGDDFVLAAVDGIKYLNEHEALFKEDNEKHLSRCKETLKFYKISKELTVRNHTIGSWEDEGIITKFKCLQQSCYATYKDDEFKITVSSLNKTKGSEYLMKISNGNVDKAFANFNRNLVVPPEYSGNMDTKKSPDTISGYIKDYTGKESYYESKGYFYIKAIGWKFKAEDDETQEEMLHEMEIEEQLVMN